MIAKIGFSKMVASGNDFILLDQRRRASMQRLGSLAMQICDRKFGAGADGLLILEKSKKADVKMRIFNPDGSEPQMCGNGARCAALYSVGRRRGKQIRIETRAGIIEAKVNQNDTKVRMTPPKDIKLELPLIVSRKKINVDFINTGVPHVVIFVEGLDKINVVNIGRQIRFHKEFLPEGTNVDFVQIIDDDNIKLRTYERGVEDETLACGTGAVAAALIDARRYRLVLSRKINVLTRSGEVLKVEFNRINGNFNDVWLEGKVRIVYSGVYYV